MKLPRKNNRRWRNIVRDLKDINEFTKEDRRTIIKRYFNVDRNSTKYSLWGTALFVLAMAGAFYLENFDYRTFIFGGSLFLSATYMSHRFLPRPLLEEIIRGTAQNQNNLRNGASPTYSLERYNLDTLMEALL